MGALQPGMPNPALIPENWNILIIDLKDCFFTIALHPNDTKRFAFTLPALNQSSFDIARTQHAIFHQNARGLCQQYNIPLAQARAIVRACPVCSHHNGGLGLGLGV
ncbi:POK8 protein, partial [Neopipo cinnamomea]|nr:POK8 protein [Neopipo cinnamomea]